MKKYSILTFFCFAFVHSHVYAETLKETADRICHAYIDHPNDFKKIEMQDCTLDIKDEYGQSPEKCFSHMDSETKTVKNYGSFYSGGSCVSTYIREINPDLSVRTGFEIKNADVNGYNFGSDDYALDYKGQFLLSDGNDLRLRQGNEEIILCGFYYQSSGWRPSEPEDNPVCQKFANREFTTRPHPIDESEEAKWPEYPEGWPSVYFQSDLNADGRKETIVAYGYASGRGCGCDGSILMVHDSNGAEDEFAEGLLELTKGCDRKDTIMKIIMIDGRDYVLFDRQIDPKRKGTPYLSYKIPTRELYEYRNDKFIKICSQDADTKRVIQHEVSTTAEHGWLNYKPL